MEKENKKSRDAAKRKYQEAVRALVDFVKKRDKRVIQHQVRERAIEGGRIRESNESGNRQH
jgi:fumarylacetoacetate (FAA) hydrolase family protein